MRNRQKTSSAKTQKQGKSLAYLAAERKSEQGGSADQGKKLLFYCNYKGKPLKWEGNDLICSFTGFRDERMSKVNKKLGSYCRNPSEG